MIKIVTSGTTAATDAFLSKMMQFNPASKVHRLAQRGVDALRSATPRDTGETADSWSYEVVQNGSETSIWWRNSHEVNGFNVAIGLRYGHGTGSGGYVQGYNYIAPALRPVFDEIADAVWEEVQRS